MMEIEVLSADVTALLNEICRRGVPLSQIRQKGFEVTFSISAADLTVVRDIVDRRGDKLKIRRHSFGKSVRHVLERHPVLILGIIGLLVLSMWLPTRILFVQVEGNERIPAKQILEHSGFCGVFFGAIRGQVRNEAVKNFLLDQIPELQWVGVNTKGCVATISVKERPENQKAPIVGNANMVASRDASIKSMTVSRGTAQCQVGQVIRAGELLISGYTDCGGVILHTRAEGEVLGQTLRQILAVAPEIRLCRSVSTGSVRKFSLRIGKKQINFSQGSGILDGTCVKMEREYILTLPGGFELPVSLIEERWVSYATESDLIDHQGLLAEAAEDYLHSVMVAGQILDRQLSFDGNTLYGSYACLEMIGQLQYEENTNIYGKSDGTNSQR